MDREEFLQRISERREAKKPVMQTRRMLVGHDYMAVRVLERSRLNHVIRMEEVATILAKQMAFENNDPIPNDAESHAFFVDQGYVVTFAWIEWEPTIVRQTKDSTELGHLSAEVDPALNEFGLSRNQLHTILDMASIVISDDDWREKMGNEITMEQDEFDVLYQAVEKELAVLENRTLGGE